MFANRERSHRLSPPFRKRKAKASSAAANALTVPRSHPARPQGSRQNTQKLNHKKHMKKFLTIIGLAAASLAGVHAQVIYNGGNYSENFDGLISTGNVASVFSATIGTQAGIPSLAGWQGAKIAGTGTSATNFTTDTGSSNSGGLYSYGNTPTSDRALGALASGSNTMTFGASFTNNTTSTLTSVTITFDAEFWRSSTTSVNTLSFFYGLSSTSGLTNSNFLSSSSMIALTSLDVFGPPPVSSNGALDGNLSGNRSAGVTATFAATWNVGDTLFIAWRDTNDGGNDAGLAVDNFRLSAVPEPSAVALLGAAALGAAVIFRRRKLNS